MIYIYINPSQSVTKQGCVSFRGCDSIQKGCEVNNEHWPSDHSTWF